MRKQSDQQKCWGVLSDIESNDLPSDGRSDVRTKDNPESLSEVRTPAWTIAIVMMMTTEEESSAVVATVPLTSPAKGVPKTRKQSFHSVPGNSF
jgi:hypothetical protein